MLLLMIAALLAAAAKASQLPIVVWHGLGDDCCSESGMSIFLTTLQDATERPVYTIRIGKNSREDRWNSLFDDANEQVRQVCADLKRQPMLQNGFDAVGLSQGGQLFRAYVQRCNNPPVRRLVTIGSQHYGVISPPGCVVPATSNDPQDFTSDSDNDDEDDNAPKWKLKYPKCSWWKRLLTSPRIIYSTRVQRSVLPAQYYRDPKHLQLYLQRNQFLADINNETSKKNGTYKTNMEQLERFVMFKFDQERVVVPPDSSWFGHVDATGNVVSMRESVLYREDWIGLRTLDESGRVRLMTLPGPHMNITTDFINNELSNQLNN